MARTTAGSKRPIDFTRARRGAVVTSSGKTKISIRIDAAVLEHFRAVAERQGGGSYQTLINHALVAHIQQVSVLDAARRALREELADCGWSPPRKATRGNGLNPRSG